MTILTRPNAALFLAFLLALGAAWYLQAAAAPADLGSAANLAAGHPPDAWRIDLNGAPVEELVLLNGIGEKSAWKIVDERERGGPFRSWDDFASRMDGMGRYMERIADEARISDAGE